MKEKKYLCIFIFLLALFMGFHFIVWISFTKDLFIQKENNSIGDLGRMSYIAKSLTLRKNEQNLPLKHIEYNDNVEIDILTIGDSFSNGGGEGTNKYYQDYIATIKNLRVMNIQPSNEGFIETVLILNNSGILDKLNPKIIILESVERTAINRYSKAIDWNIGLKDYSISFLYKKYSHSNPIPSFMNNLNYNALLYSLLYRYDDNAIFSDVYISNLTKNLFSCENKDKLLFYFEDLKDIPQSNNESISLLNENLNKLQQILNEKNIELYFMPAVDKYNLYSKYILNNKYNKSSFFELLREEKKLYKLIDTKLILENMVDNDEIDVYYSDDTHWSNKASEEIVKNIKF
jgi:hypothetical protein